MHSSCVLYMFELNYTECVFHKLCCKNSFPLYFVTFPLPGKRICWKILSGMMYWSNKPYICACNLQSFAKPLMRLPGHGLEGFFLQKHRVQHSTTFSSVRVQFQYKWVMDISGQRNLILKLPLWGKAASFSTSKVMSFMDDPNCRLLVKCQGTSTI